MALKVELVDQKPPMSKNDIVRLQEQLKTFFPTDYVVFLSQHNVARAASNQVSAGALTESIDTFFGRSENENQDLIHINQTRYSGRIPDRVIAIADAPGGNLFCLHCTTGAVYFWDHEEETDEAPPNFENMKMIASSFGRFLEMLVPAEPITFLGTRSPGKKSPDFNEKFAKFLKKK